ncbi:MAG TPA: single-stranded-DNA-specific exonuclease RecJ [Gemmatimonadaceae bacterium]|nr:single-stranded-DNA-specific exonuclease RecJ [Gemmatimonadaceae bacterium]
MTASALRGPSRWVLPGALDETAARALAAELHLPLAVCQLLCARGFGETTAAKRFLRPRFDQLHDPLTMLGLDDAVERVATAIARAETILIHGDYDVDGMASTALLMRALRAFGARVVPFVPRRIEDGYDLSAAGVAAARAAGAGLVITADCGTNAVAAVDDLTAAGIDVIITDHHLPGPHTTLPRCVAVLNPRRPGCGYPDKDLAAAGVAFKLALALARRLGASEGPVFALLDLVALATIADVAPLRGENRVFVRYGLRLMAESPNVGIRALIRASGLEGKALTAGRVGFILAPRLNAVGRIARGLRGVELLTTENEADALRIAREMEECNRRRQELDRATLDQARTMVDGLDLDATYGLVLADEGWHPGVIGIVASRLVEETGRPTVLVALDGDGGRGSGRSIPAFDLHAALAECAPVLERFGGHRAAAGVTVTRANVPAFAERFNAVARARLAPEDLVAEVRVDLELKIDEITGDLEAMLRHFEPFGVGNPAPALLVRGVRLAGPPRALAEHGLKLRLATATGELDAVAWGAAHRVAEVEAVGGGGLDLVFRVERDDWQGVSRLQAKVTDFRV